LFQAAGSLGSSSLRRFLVADVVQKTGVGQVAAGGIRVTAQKVLVMFADNIQPGHDAPVEFRFGFASALGGEGIIVLNPFVHLGHGGIVFAH